MSPAVLPPESSIVAWTLARNVWTLRFDGLIRILPLAKRRIVWPRKSKPSVDMRDPGLLVGEFETPLLQEVFHERLDFTVQEDLRCARDDEVIRIADQMDLASRRCRRVAPKRSRQQTLAVHPGPDSPARGRRSPLEVCLPWWRTGRASPGTRPSATSGAPPCPWGCGRSTSRWLIRSKQALISPSKIQLGPGGPLEDLVAFVQGIGTAAFRPKAVGMAVGEGFRDGIEAEQVQGLHGPIGHRGDAQGASLCRCSWGCTPCGAVAVDSRAGAGR